MSNLKTLFSNMIEAKGDFSKVDGSMKKQHLKLFVKESFPHFLVADGSYYVQAYFTKKAVDGFKSKNDSVNITDLKSKVIVINDWSLEMAKVNSNEVFTSYSGCQVRLVVNGFANDKQKSGAKVYPSNLFRDSEIKTLIQHFHHEGTVHAAAKAKADMPEVGAKCGSGGGSVNIQSGWSFKEGKTATMDMNAIFKAEKGSDAYKKLNQSQSSGKVKATGGKSGGKKSGKKVGSKGFMSKLMTPGDNKRSTAHLNTFNKSPGDFAGDKHSTSLKTKKEFAKFLKTIKGGKK